jgi:tetratricopeptide (TPR) repeat protein
VVAVAAPVSELGGDGTAGGGAELGLVPAAVRAGLLRSLAGLRGVAAVTAEPGEPDEPLPLARAAAADEALASRIDCRGRLCRITLRRVTPRDGRVFGVVSYEVPGDDVELLARATVTYVRRLYGGFGHRSGGGLEVTATDYRRYLVLEREARAQTTGERSVDGLLAAAREVRRGSPRFLEIYLLEARLRGRRFFSSREATDLDQAEALLDQAERIAPDDPRVPIARHAVALAADRLGEAEAAVADLERIAPGDPRLSPLRALVLERRGRGGEALAEMERAVARRPARQDLLDLANLATRQGRVALARKTLESLLRRFPEDRGVETLLAQLELLSGRPERAVELYRRLLRESPGLAEETNLGLAYLLLGRDGEAAARFERAQELAPASALVILNRADAEFLAGRREVAARLYAEVLARLDQDPAPGFWQSLSLRAQALAHLGRQREAVKAAEEARRRAPDNPQVAYEVALVYALAGDLTSASLEAERALDGGVQPRWFGFPWFDALRQDPTFAAHLAAARRSPQ